MRVIAPDEETKRAKRIDEFASKTARIEQWYQSMADAYGLSVSSFPQLSEEEAAEARYDAYLERERERGINVA